MQINKDHSRDITNRFLQAIDQIMTGTGKRITLITVASIVGMNPSNINRLRKDETKNVTLNACYQLCHYYKISASWLILGIGPMYANNEALSARNGAAISVTELKKAKQLIEQSIRLIERSK